MVDLLKLCNGFDLEHALYVDQSPAVIRRAELLIWSLQFERYSLYHAKNLKIAKRQADAEAEEAKKTAKPLTAKQKEERAQKELQEAEKRRLADDFEYYGWEKRDWKIIELINAVRDTTFDGKPEDFPASRGPGDSFLPKPVELIDQNDDAALLAAFAV